ARPVRVRPDGLVRRDREEGGTLIATSRPVVEHLLAVMSNRLDLDDPRQRATLVAEVLPAIAEVADPVMRAEYVRRLAALAKMGRLTGEETLNRQLGALRRQRDRVPRPGGGDTERALLPARAIRAPREEFCLAMLFLRPEVRALAGGL